MWHEVKNIRYNISWTRWWFGFDWTFNDRIATIGLTFGPLFIRWQKVNDARS